MNLPLASRQAQPAKLVPAADGVGVNVAARAIAWRIALSWKSMGMILLFL
jgi:hypothetical protein